MPIDPSKSLALATKFSEVSLAFDSIFMAKEEFIFVFGGKNSTRTIDSVEVFDVHREIWREFGVNASKRSLMQAV
jgi:hypothetical protein